MRENSVEFEVTGRTALFTDPASKTGGEKCSLQVPTYEALKGIIKSVYWKPTFIWIIDRVRVMNPIRTEGRGIKTRKYTGGHDISEYTYLTDVRYQVEAHFEWNMNRPEFGQDRVGGKHLTMAKKMLQRGGYRDICLGTRECQAYVRPCRFGSGAGAYDGTGEFGLGFMYHGITYADEAATADMRGRMTVNFWHPVMRDGVIEFPRPERTPLHKFLHETGMKEFGQKGGSYGDIPESDKDVRHA